MRRTSRTSIVAILLAVPALAGCGTSQIAGDEVPGGPPVLTVPSDSALGAAGSKADSSSSSGSSADEDSSAGSDSGTADSGATPTPTPQADTSGGTTAPEATPAPQDATGGSAPPPAGSSPEQFENFCEQNAGAC